MGLKLSPVKSSGQFIKIRKSGTKKVKSSAIADPDLFWDKYSITDPYHDIPSYVFNSLPQLAVYQDEFEKLDRYSLTELQGTYTTYDNSYGAGVCERINEVFPGYFRGMLEKVPKDDRANWAVNGKILGLVNTEHNIVWSAIYKTSEKDKPEYNYAYDVWDCSFPEVYSHILKTFPDGMDVLTEPGYYFSDEGSPSPSVTVVTLPIVSIIYNRIWVRLPYVQESPENFYGGPMTLSGTLEVSATVDGISTKVITLEIVRIISTLPTV